MLDYKLDSKAVIISHSKRAWPFLLISVSCHLVLGAACFLINERTDYSEVKAYPVELIFTQETNKPELSSPTQENLAAAKPDKVSFKTSADKGKTNHSSSAPSSQGLVLQSGNPQPPYPVSAQENGIEGKVKVNLLVGARGEVETIEVASPKAHPTLENSVLETVRHWKFEPPSAALKTNYEFIFKLEV